MSNQLPGDERGPTTGGFAVGDRVGPKLNNCYGKVTWVGGCSLRNTGTWCKDNCLNVEMECMNMTHDHYDDTRRTCFTANELRHLD